MKLRLLLFEACPKNCPLCSNKGFDLKALPVVDGFAGYEEILLTGGEPMLEPELVRRVIREIRQQTDAPVYMYTAWLKDPLAFMDVLRLLDGICVSLHTQEDVWPFIVTDTLLFLNWEEYENKNLRLKIFEGIPKMATELDPNRRWQIERVQWIRNCPLPENEVFMRLP